MSRHGNRETSPLMGAVAVIGLLAFVGGIISFLIWGSVRIVADIRFGIDCEGHLKRAADANSIELARQELAVATGYLERHGMTAGYTSVLYNEPSEDVGFWFRNLRASLQRLDREPATASELEKSNLLLKLRETLLDVTSSGETVTEPSGISIFPHNAFYAWWGWISLPAAITGFLAMGAGTGFHLRKARSKP
jgi:hypothetical protein